VPVLLWYGTPIPYSKTYDFVINLEEEMPKITPSDEMPTIPEELRSDDNLARFIYTELNMPGTLGWDSLIGVDHHRREPYLETARKVRKMFLPFQQATAQKAVVAEIRARLDEHQRFIDKAASTLRKTGHGWPSTASLEKQATHLETVVKMLESSKQRVVDIRQLSGDWGREAAELRRTADMIQAHIPEQALALRGLAGGLEVARARIAETLDPDRVPLADRLQDEDDD
jgi:hypothetical protein